METVDLRTFEGVDLKKGKELSVEVPDDCEVSLDLRSTAPVEVSFVDREGVVLPWWEGNTLSLHMRIVGAAWLKILATEDSLIAYRGRFAAVADGGQIDREPLEIVLSDDGPKMVLSPDVEMLLRARLAEMGMEGHDVDTLLNDDEWADDEGMLDDDDVPTEYQERELLAGELELPPQEPLPSQAEPATSPAMPVNASPTAQAPASEQKPIAST